MWSVLFLTLPTRQTTSRMRIRRALQALGSPLLHDGAYLLPSDKADGFAPLIAEAREHGGMAAVMALAPTDETQRRAIESLFDRSGQYAAWMQQLADFERSLPDLRADEALSGHARLSLRLKAILDIDYYPGPGGARARAGLAACAQRVRRLRAVAEDRMDGMGCLLAA